MKHPERSKELMGITVSGIDRAPSSLCSSECCFRDNRRMALILGIESSCDETAAAVIRDGKQQLSNVVASQLAHQQYGGVVPEIAAREHLRAIAPVVRKALADANVTPEHLSAIAVTQGPGLAGALLVGISYAKAMAFALDKPLI